MPSIGPLAAALDELIQLILGAEAAAPDPQPFDEPINHLVGSHDQTIKTPLPLGDVLPTVASVAAILADLTPNQRAAALRSRLSQVSAYVGELRKRPAGPTPSATELDRLDAELAVHPAFPWPLADAGQGPFDDLGLRLRLSQPQTGGEPITNQVGLVLLDSALQGGADGVDLSFFMPAGQEVRAANALAELRRVDDVYKRFDIASRAARISGLSMARMLALYRNEGDMLVPPSVGSLQGMDLPPIADHRIPWPTGRTAADAFLGWKPSVEFGVWVADPGRVAEVGFAGRARELANLHWHVAMGGLDIMFVPGFRPRAIAGGRLSLQQWLRVLRPDLPPNARPSRWDEYISVIHQLRIIPERTHTTGQPTALVAAPVDPVSYATAIMSIAGQHFVRCHDISYLLGGEPAAMPDVLAYLVYHQQQDGALGVVLSAMAHAAKGTTERGRPLRQAVARDASPTLKGVLPPIPHPSTTTEMVRTTAVDNRAHIAAFLRTANNLQTLADFVMTARKADWSSFMDGSKGSVRGNVLRYMQLLTFYRAWLREPA